MTFLTETPRSALLLPTQALGTRALQRTPPRWQGDLCSQQHGGWQWLSWTGSMERDELVLGPLRDDSFRHTEDARTIPNLIFIP